MDMLQEAATSSGLPQRKDRGTGYGVQGRGLSFLWLRVWGFFKSDWKYAHYPYDYNDFPEISHQGSGPLDDPMTVRLTDPSLLTR